MASRKTLLVAAASALVAAVALLPLPATASKKTFTVGDDDGWTTGVDYVAWAKGKKFTVGDTLVFLYKDPGQDLVMVDEQSFDNCLSGDNAQVLSYGSSIQVRLTYVGKLFFISDAEGACDSGMKLSINVVH